MVIADAQKLDACVLRRIALKKQFKHGIELLVVKRPLAKVVKNSQGFQVLVVGAESAAWCQEQRGLCRQASGGNRGLEVAHSFGGKLWGQGCVG